MKAVDREALVRIIQEACSPRVLDAPDYDRPFQDLGLDSLDLASVFLGIEETYGIRIPDEEAKNLSTINALAGFLAGRLGDR